MQGFNYNNKSRYAPTNEKNNMNIKTDYIRQNRGRKDNLRSECESSERQQKAIFQPWGKKFIQTQ